MVINIIADFFHHLGERDSGCLGTGLHVIAAGTIGDRLSVFSLGVHVGICELKRWKWAVLLGGFVLT